MGLGITWLRGTLLPTYYYGTWIYRRAAGLVAARLGRYPIAAVYYHRVADHTPTPWTISNSDFARQIHWLMLHFEVISLGEAQRRIASGRNSRPAVCITFDDGYAENFEQALPLLLDRKLPFTYFVATDFVYGNKPFPHDVACGNPLPPNSPAQIRCLAEQGVGIGAHTRSHLDLGPITDRATLHREIVGSRDDLQQHLGRPVRFFAFPFGLHANLSQAAMEVARDAGFAGVCSAYGGYNFPGGDAFHLQRFHADPHFLRFKNWLMLDPRMTSRTSRCADRDRCSDYPRGGR